MGKNNKEMVKSKSIKLNAILNVLKQSCAILFPLITFPYITRTLHVDNYGKVNMATTFVGYFSLIATMGFGTYAVRESTGFRNDKKKFDNFACQIFTMNVLTTIIAYFLLLSFLFILRTFDSYRDIILICSMNIIFVTLGQDWINSVFEDYLYITIRYILTHVLSVILIIMFVKNETDIGVYAFLIVIPTAIANVLNMLYIRKYAKIHLVRHVEISKHIIPSIILFVNGAIISIYVNFDTTMLGVMKGDTEVGIYSTATRIYALAKQIVNALVVVAIPRMSYYIGNEMRNEYQNLFQKTMNGLMTMVMPAVVGLFMISKNLILIMSGKEYAPSHIALKILSISLPFAVMASLFIQCVLVPCRKEKVIFKITLFSAILNILLNLFFIPLFSYVGAAITTVLAEVGIFILGYVNIRDKIDFKGVSNDVKGILIGCIFIIVVCYICEKIFSDIFICTFSAIIISIMGYGIILLLFKNEVAYPTIANLINKLRRK